MLKIRLFYIIVVFLSTSLSYANEIVKVKDAGAYNVHVCKVKEETVTKVEQVSELLAQHEGNMDALSEEDQKLLSNFCFKSENCECRTLMAGQQAEYHSSDEVQVIVAKPISGLGPLLGTLAAVFAIAITFVTVGLAIPVISIVSAAGISALFVGVGNIVYASLLITSTLVAASSWAALGYIIHGSVNLTTPTKTVEALSELPPVMIGIDENAAFIIPLYNGETLKFTGTAAAQNFYVENDKIKEFAAGAQEGYFTVSNGGGYTMHACYERECVHLLAGQHKQFRYIPKQELLTIIHGGPAPQTLTVYPGETVRFTGLVGTPFYNVENSAIPPNTTDAPICVDGVVGIGYVGRACYGRECKKVTLTRSQKFNVEKDAVMSVKAEAGNFARPKNGSKEEYFFSVEPGDTVNLWGTTGKPYYSITPNSCKR